MGRITIYNTSCLNQGYSHNNGTCQNNSKWMSKLKDNKTLSSLSIPGTHDTMSLGFGGDIAQTQSKTLENQLISGVRFLDIRLAARPQSKDFLYLHHGFVYLNATFNQVLNILINFLKNNPTETIIMRLKQEYTNESYDVFIALLEKFLNNPAYSNYVYNNIQNTNPTLKELRGKILVLQNFGGTLKWMSYSNNFYIQDHYILKNNWDLYSKWEKVKSHLMEANQSFLKGNSTKFMNFTSANEGSFPYFVASGHSSPQTSAPNLLTGLTEPAFKSYYPDFPRVNRFGIFSSIAFEGINELTKAYIDKNKPSYVGIIVSDFPGQGLINSIININNF